MAAGATIIRRLLVDYAQARKARKRGGSKNRQIPLHVSVADSASQVDILELNDALENLAGQSARAAQIVELKFFGGLSGGEIAEYVGVSLRTVQKDWRFAKACLYRILKPEGEGRPGHE